MGLPPLSPDFKLMPFTVAPCARFEISLGCSFAREKKLNQSVMDQFDCREQNNSTCGFATDLQSDCGNGRGVEDLGLEMAAVETSGQTCSVFHAVEEPSSQQTAERDGSSDSLHLEDYSPFSDISSALRSVALMDTWDLNKFHFPLPKLTSAPGGQTVGSASASPDDRDARFAREVDPAEDEVPSISFQSKYMHIFPLYQDYCLQDVRDDVHRLKESLVSELISPGYLQGLPSRLGPRRQSEAGVTRSSSPSLSSPLPQPVRVTPCTLWQDLEEVKASGLLGGLTAGEIRLQESMFELIASEASYLRSLAVAVNHFYASKALKRTLSQREHHILFSNIRHVMAASEKFLVDLERRLGESVFMSEVGDVVLEHCKAFHGLYVPYVTNMMYQETLIKQQLQQNRHFTFVLRTLESDPVCQRQTLKSFLVLPFQRITRIKLLLETILKLTEPKSGSFSNLEKARAAVHQIVVECDQGVRKMKQIEQLVCLEMLLDFSRVKALPIIKSSRFLVHQGALKQLMVLSSSSPRTSFIGVYLHLFNDLLIVSLKKDQRFVVVDHAKFITHVKVENLKTEILGLPPNAFLLHLAESQTGQPTASILVAQTKTEKESWLKLLSAEVSSPHNS